MDTAEFVEVSDRQPQHGVRALRVALLALEVPQHQILDVRAHLLLRDAPILHVDRVLPVEVAASVGPCRTRRECIVGTGGRGGGGGTPAVEDAFNR